MKRGLWIPALALACTVAIVGPDVEAQGGAPSKATEERELIVLLASGPGAPRAEDVVQNARQALPLQGNLGLGDPEEVRFAIEQRAGGPLLDATEADPDDPCLRLEHYIVLRYPAGANVEAIRQALLQSPHVLAVEESRPGQLAVVPTDPMFPPAGPSTPPSQYQWGSATLNLTAAWDYTKGHAYVGTVDTGIDTTHPDLVGNFRPHLSHDVGYDDDNVDEGQPQPMGSPSPSPSPSPAPLFTPTHAGHGTHTAGIIGATANNGMGVAGACWGCSLLIAKVTALMNIPCQGCVANTYFNQKTFAAGLKWLVDHGAQVANMSLGDRPGPADCSSPNIMCDAVACAAKRDVFMVAASGNSDPVSAWYAIDYPARDPRVLAAGGIVPDGTFWAGSNRGPEQEVVAPAFQILSTFYRGLLWNPTCKEATVGSGYGPCTGTSMASPYTAGLAGLARSVNPLLSMDNIQTLLRSTASFGTFHDNQMGFGIPNALAAVQTALGRAGGAVLPNRLTPLFSFYSGAARDSFYTTVPQMATAAEAVRSYEPIGPVVPGYGAFPGAPLPCTGCRTLPGASVYIFSGDRAPGAGVPPLVPLYRLTYFDPAPSSLHRDTTYTTTPDGIAVFTHLGYKLDGIEGYIYQACAPEPQCIPAGAVRLYRFYNPSRDDWAIFPESELAAMQAAGYASQPNAAPWIGYVYPNTDTDGDHLIDGFEGLIGTNPARADTDCDGMSDGNEVLQYPPSDPLGTSQCGQPPVARFTFSCVGRSCSFDGSGSTGTVGITSWAWNFGDGATGSGQTASHAYSANNTYTVTLTVADSASLTGQTTHSVAVHDDPPHASFSVTCNGLTCWADAEASSDDYGIVNYTWTWGDGQTTSGGSPASAPSHTYAATGSYTITLVVRDAADQTASDSHSVSLSQAPTASFEITCSTSRSCNVNGSASTDDLGIASYTWDWDDESWTTTAGPMATHVYSYDGTFTVHLLVTDTSGNTSGTVRTVTLPHLRGDFNGDRRADLVWRKQSSGENALWLLNQGGLAITDLSGADPLWRLAASGDFNRDGNDDLVWQDDATGRAAVWYMAGSTFVSAALLPPQGPGWRIVGAGDVNGDGYADLTTSNEGANILTVLLMRDTTRIDALSFGVDPGWQAQGTGDFDGDGRADVVWRHSSSGALVIWGGLAAAGAHSVAHLPSVTNPSWTIGAIADFDRDGCADLAWRNSSTGANAVWYLRADTVTESDGTVTKPVKGTDSFPTNPDLAWQIVAPR